MVFSIYEMINLSKWKNVGWQSLNPACRTETIDSSPKIDRCRLRGQVLVTSYVAVIGPVASATVLRNIVKNPITSIKYTVLGTILIRAFKRFGSTIYRFGFCAAFCSVSLRFGSCWFRFPVPPQTFGTTQLGQPLCLIGLKELEVGQIPSSELT